MSESVPESLARTLARRWPVVRFLAGVALDVAALAMLAVFVWGALVPYHYDSTRPPIGQVQDARTGLVFEVDDEALDQAFEDRINHANRVIGALGATASGVALALGWRLWRRPWRQRTPAVRRPRTVIAAVSLSPVAAISLFIVIAALVMAYDWMFGGLTRCRTRRLPRPVPRASGRGRRVSPP